MKLNIAGLLQVASLEDQEPDYRTAIEIFEEETLLPIVLFLSYVFFAIGVAILFFYIVRLLATSGYKNKFDFINENEINYLWYAALGILIGISLHIDTLLIAESILWFMIKIVVIGLMASIVGVTIYYSLKFYYPFFISKRLNKLREIPRVNPNTGNKMRKLSEEEEDEYLDEGMQAEEDAFSVDYDVWIDEGEGGNKFVTIEKYGGRDGKSSAAQLCPDCSYQTLKIVKTEIVTAPTINESGLIERFYKCSYCSYKLKDQKTVPKLKE